PCLRAHTRRVPPSLSALPSNVLRRGSGPLVRVSSVVLRYLKRNLPIALSKARAVPKHGRSFRTRKLGVFPKNDRILRIFLCSFSIHVMKIVNVVVLNRSISGCCSCDVI